MLSDGTANKVNRTKPVQIFSKSDNSVGVNVVKSPVKLTILELLKNSDMEFNEIVENTGRSKSTISVHLKSLREEGVVNYRFDSEDNRKKIFYISSRFLGEVKPSEPLELEERKIDFLVNNIINSGDDFEFSYLLFHTLRSTLFQEGVNIDPILHETGVNIGLSLYSKLYDEDFGKFFENIKDFWSEKGLGKITLELMGDSYKIRSFDCFECGLLPKTGKPACYLEAGIFEALFSSYLKYKVNVIEVTCYTMGDDCCTFEIEATNEEYSLISSIPI
ncbi:V4R domain-containing protein [uncultured Methanobrevibacter sp.]|uniref:V4R domain-containing protein n=1 Tax=uncultured Methanobrevibacter sp. TaxID=253161 RepID=UPI0025D25A2F|nr:V4R domain-containing protein [uncultured Methanobrevibacter sp.]